MFFLVCQVVLKKFFKFFIKFCFFALCFVFLTLFLENTKFWGVFLNFSAILL